MKTGTFAIKTQKYTGPFDLLLLAIKDQKLQIFDISLSEITSSYFEYLKQFESINLSLASEFLFMAALLLEMKSKEILPKPFGIQLQMEEEEIEQDLAKHLEEYKFFQQLAEGLRQRGSTFSKVYARFNREIPKIDKREYILKDVSLDELLLAFKRVWDSIPTYREFQQIEDEDITLPQRIEEVLTLARRSSEGVPFENLFIRCTRLEVVVTFLAILELAKRKEIRIFQGGVFDGINIRCS